MTKRTHPDSECDTSLRPTKQRHVDEDVPSLLLALPVELRHVIYDMSSVEDRARLANTCWLLYHELGAPRYLALPQNWRSHIMDEPDAESRALYRNLVETHLRPARFFERIPAVAEVVDLQPSGVMLPNTTTLFLDDPSNLDEFIEEAIRAGKDAVEERRLRAADDDYTRLVEHVDFHLRELEFLCTHLQEVMHWKTGNPRKRLEALIGIELPHVAETLTRVAHDLCARRRLRETL